MQQENILLAAVSELSDRMVDAKVYHGGHWAGIL